MYWPITVTALTIGGCMSAGRSPRLWSMAFLVSATASDRFFDSSNSTTTLTRPLVTVVRRCLRP